MSGKVLFLVHHTYLTQEKEVEKKQGEREREGKGVLCPRITKIKTSQLLPYLSHFRLVEKNDPKKS